MVEEGSEALPPLSCPFSASLMPQSPGSLCLQTYHEDLLGEDLLLIEVSEPLGLLLQLLPQHRISLRGQGSESYCAQDRTASANTSFTKVFTRIQRGHVESAGLRCQKPRPP